MILVRPLKRVALQAFQRTGGFNFVADSDWRRQRLLILCYHGISLDDEHLWNGALYMPPELLEQRLQALQSAKCNVLPLGEAVERLYSGTLPERSVAITFDDGYEDFVERAYPVLAEYGMPATVYLPTLHAGRGTPLFSVGPGYMLWKARGKRVSVPQVRSEPFDLRTDEGRQEALNAIHDVARRDKLSHSDRGLLMAQVADAIGVDYGAIVERKILQIMAPERAAQMSEAGVDIELHTHRHRTPNDRLKFLDEIETNRQKIEAVTGKYARHFCYPSGAYESNFLPWLAECGVISATTCDPGLASRSTPPLMLPRLVDTCGTTASEFQGWLSGAAWLITPKRSYAHADPSVV